MATIQDLQKAQTAHDAEIANLKATIDELQAQLAGITIPPAVQDAIDAQVAAVKASTALVIQANTEASNISTQPFQGFNPPVAAITPSNNGLTVTFDASASTPGSNPLATYQFNFGDGILSDPQKAPTIDHTYAHNGNYAAMVIVADTKGIVGKQITNVPVQELNGPTAVLVLTNNGLTITADASQSKQGDTVLVEGKLDFGDGNGAIMPDLKMDYTYAKPGTYTVTLTAIDDAGTAATTTADITVK